MPDMRCNGCGRHPNEIEEYIAAAADDDTTPAEFVLQEEGTLNPENHHFWCTECYVRAGCPLGVAR
jgi:hypothetical protein